MALSRHLPLANIKVIATDIDKQVIDTARMGLYNEKSIASVPDDLKKKYFTKVGNSYQISDEIKKRVEFKEHDLLKDPYPGGCNLIVGLWLDNEKLKGMLSNGLLFILRYKLVREEHGVQLYWLLMILLFILNKR